MTVGWCQIDPATLERLALLGYGSGQCLATSRSSASRPAPSRPRWRVTKDRCRQVGRQLAGEPDHRLDVHPWTRRSRSHRDCPCPAPRVPRPWRRPVKPGPEGGSLPFLTAEGCPGHHKLGRSRSRKPSQVHSCPTKVISRAYHQLGVQASTAASCRCRPATAVGRPHRSDTLVESIRPVCFRAKAAKISDRYGQRGRRRRPGEVRVPWLAARRRAGVARW